MRWIANTTVEGGSYSTVRRFEELMYQHFSAKSFHQIDNRPDHLIEWQEIMQHHLIPSRLMDWSEQSALALLFSIEAFIAAEDNPHWQEKRLHASPCVWVLNPARLNEKVYDALCDQEVIHQLVDDVMEEAILQAGLTQKENIVRRVLTDRIFASMKAYGKIYGKSAQGKTAHIDSIVSLSGIESMRQAAGNRLSNLVIRKQFNPYYYLLARVFIDGVVVRDRIIPPIAEVHPYHSERIRAQKGVFTVFPFHETDALPMEFHEDCSECLFQIRVVNPRKMAQELLQAGYRRSHLYPELEYVSQDIKNGSYRF